MPSKTEYPPRERAEFLCDTAGSILSVHVRGEIDHHTAASIRQGIDATLFEKRPAKLILDLSAVSFMDSSGLGLIMGRYSVMKELGGEMVVWNPSTETRAILTLAGMERLVKIIYPEGGEPPAPQSHPAKSASRQPSAEREGTASPRTSPRAPRRRKKNGLVYETDPRKEKNA